MNQLKIAVIGAGGTGGNYLKELGRYLYSKKKDIDISLSIVDGDRVEKRNIARQPFIPEDIGEYKAVAMAGALQEVFDLNTRAYPMYINDYKDMEPFWGTIPVRDREILYIMIGCVDNHHARKVMHEYFRHTKHNIIYLDSANEFESGEIVIAGKIRGKIIGKDRLFYYPNLFRGKLLSAQELSCVELNEVAPQHLVTNLLAANILLSQTISCIEGRVNPGIIYFNAFSSQSRYIPYERKVDEIDKKRKRRSA